MDLGFYLGIHPLGALSIVLTTIVVYLLLTLVISRWGQRLFASLAATDLALMLIIGAVAGRTLLGPEPTLAGGLIALATLFGLQQVAVRARRGRTGSPGGEALMVGPEPQREVMHRHHVDDHALWATLRQAGVRAPSDVGLVVLEQDGSISVLRSDQPVHRQALEGIRDADQVHARLLAAGLA